MLSLFIDTTQTYCNLAILKQNKIIAKTKIKTNNNLTDIVIEHICSLLKKAEIDKHDIKKILVVIGPGSFTGVRVGVLIAQTWKLIQGTQIYTIDALRLQIPKDTGLSILDARGNLLYVALYKKNRCSIKPQLISNQHAQQLIKKYQNYGVYIQYKSVDIFENLIKHINEFKLVKNVLVLQPLYIKKPL